MRHMNKALLSGTALIVLLGLPAVAQDSPYPSADAHVVVIDQVVLGDVFANMHVIVPDYATGAAAAATALGNTSTADGINKDVDYDASQVQSGVITASTSLTGGVVSGGTATTVTTAYGNAASSSTSVETDFHNVIQTSNGNVSAFSDLVLDGADDVVAMTTATANVSSYSTDTGTNRGFSTQTGNADVMAATNADLCCNNSSASLGSVATGNSTASYGATTTNYNGAVQSMAAGTKVTASTEAVVGSGTNVAVSATSAGNNTKVENTFGYAKLGGAGSPVYQTNGAAVTSNSVLTLNNWSGTSGSTSYGVGNSALISNVGSDTVLYGDQINNGQVTTYSEFNGSSADSSYGYASSTSIGNAATATLCYTCSSDGILTGNMSQTNNANTIASAYTSVTNTGYVSGAATAVGNSATYQSFGD